MQHSVRIEVQLPHGRTQWRSPAKYVHAKVDDGGEHALTMSGFRMGAFTERLLGVRGVLIQYELEDGAGEIEIRD